MPKTLPRSTHFLFCLLSAARHTDEKPHWLYMVHSVVTDKPSQVECILLQQLEISEESSEQSIEWLQLKAEPTVVTTRVRQMRRRWWSLSQWQQGRKLSTRAEENLKSLQDSALRLYRAIWDYLAVRRAFDRAPGFNRIQFMLCTKDEVTQRRPRSSITQDKALRRATE